METGLSAAQGTSARLETVLEAGDPAYSGGATDASVRLNNLLKVCTPLIFAPPGVPIHYTPAYCRQQFPTMHTPFLPSHKAGPMSLVV